MLLDDYITNHYMPLPVQQLPALIKNSFTPKPKTKGLGQGNNRRKG